MSTEQLDKIQQLAKQATPGPWFVEKHGEQINGIYADPLFIDNRIIETDGGCYPPEANDAAYIAAVSPDVLISLIAEIKLLTEIVYLALGDFPEDSPYPENEALRTENEHLKEEITRLTSPLAESRKLAVKEWDDLRAQLKEAATYKEYLEYKLGQHCHFIEEQDAKIAEKDEMLATQGKALNDAIELSIRASDQARERREQLAEAREVIETCDKVDPTFTRAYLEKYPK